MNFVQKIVSSNKLYVTNLISTFFSQAINAVTIIILTPLLSKELGLQTFGIYGVIIGVVTFSAIFDFGFNLGLLRKFIHSPNNANPLLNSILIFYLFLLFILIPTLYLLFNFILQINVTNFYLLALIVSFLIYQNIVSGFFDSILQGMHLLYISKIIRAIKILFETILIILCIKKITLFELLSITVSINFFYLFFLYFYANKKANFKLNITAFNINLIIDHFIYCIWYFFSSFASVLILNTQIFTINYLVGSIQAAKYLVINKFYDIIRVASTNFTQVLFPSIIQIESEQNWSKLKALYFKMIIRVALLVLLIITFIYTMGHFIFISWSKIYDHETVTTFKLFSILIGLIIVDNVSVIFLNALKLNKVPTFVSILQGVLSILFSYFFIKKYNLIGFVYGAGLSFIITSMLFNPLYLLRKMNNKITNT